MEIELKLFCNISLSIFLGNKRRKLCELCETERDGEDDEWISTFSKHFEIFTFFTIRFDQRNVSSLQGWMKYFVF